MPVAAARNAMFLVMAVLLSRQDGAGAAHEHNVGGGYIELTKDGYRIRSEVELEEGLDVEGDVMISGNWISKNYTERSIRPQFGGSYSDECTPEREGAIRWAYTIFEACDGEVWVPMRHCSRNCGFYLPPKPEIDYGFWQCFTGCCHSAISDQYRPLPSVRGISAENKLLMADCSVFSNFTTLENISLSMTDYVTCPGTVEAPLLNVKTVACDVAMKPPLQKMIDPATAAHACQNLPLDQMYRENMLRISCKGLTTAGDMDTCEVNLRPYLTWALPGDDEYTRQRQANQLWSDSAWWPHVQDKDGEVFFKRPSGDVVPEAFVPPSNWSASLDQKQGCDKYDYDWAGFDHLRALYNVSGWTDLVPGVERQHDGRFKLAEPADRDVSSVNVSCQLWGVWDTKWYVGGQSRYTASLDRGDRVPFEVNGRRFFSNKRANPYFTDDEVPPLDAIAGKISDGPSDYGEYVKGITFGFAFEVLSAKYTPSTDEMVPGGTIALVFTDETLDAILSEVDLDAWSGGSKIRLVPNEKKSARVMWDLAVEDHEILQVDYETKTVTLKTSLVFEAPIEVADGEVGEARRAIDSVCFPHGGGCVAGNYTGTRCAWEIQAPLGQQVSLSFKMLDLVSTDDRVYIYDVTDVNTPDESFQEIMTGHRSDLQPLANITGRSSEDGSPAQRALQTTYRSRFGGRLLVVMNTRGGNGNLRLDSRGAGFEADFMMVPRLANMLLSDRSYTGIQYAIAFLEYQNIIVSPLSLTGDAGELFDTGRGTLGNITVAERCFMSCSGQVPYFQQLKRLHHDPEHLPVWHRRPPKEQVGRDEFIGKAFVTEVEDVEIPPAVRYMGYDGAHFVRTAFVSRFPPGSFKAPAASLIGPIPVWDARGDTDPSVKPEDQPTRRSFQVGWGLRRFLMGDDVSWGDGWGQTEGDRVGKQWWDDDGANDEFAPVWHVLGPAGMPSDGKRFMFDLEHPDLALYSFVDSQRRVVMANTLAQAIPCGMLVNSSCDVSCELHGTGLNRLQCITRTLETPCGQPVVDECNNDCGLRGQARCEQSAVALGTLRVGSTGQAASSSFAFGVGRKQESGAADNALYMSHQDVTRAGVSPDLLAEFSYPLFVIDHEADSVVDTFDVTDLARRLQQDARSYAMIQKLLSGSWLYNVRWTYCSLDPPRCGEIFDAPVGWLTDYQLGHESWPSCSDFNRDSVLGAQACGSIDIRIDSQVGKPGLFDLMDRDESGFLDRDEMESLHAELEARRRVAEKEVWSRLHMTERDMLKILPLVSQGQTVPTGIHGFEFASPHCSSVEECTDVKYSTTLRISSWSEWLGEYLRLGQSRHKNVTTCSGRGTQDQACGWHLELQPLSHIHVDGVIQGSCAFELAGGSDTEKTSICVERPTETRTMLLPDASGMILTTGTIDQIPSLVGLRGNRTMQFTGESHTHSRQWKFGNLSRVQGPAPPQPRVDCSAVNCSAGGTRPRSALEFAYSTDVWHAVDLAVWHATRGKWVPKLPAYFTFECPEDDPNCDISDHLENLRKAVGVRFSKSGDGFSVTESPWPELDGDWLLADPDVLSPGSVYWTHRKLAASSAQDGVLLIRQKRNGFEGGLDAAVRPELRAESCAALSPHMALPLHHNLRRVRGLCSDLVVPGGYHQSFCDDAPKWWNSTVYSSNPYRRNPDGAGDGIKMRLGVSDEEACCVLGGGSTPAHAYDWLRLYYREGAYRRAHPRSNVTGLGRTGLLHSDSTDESEWGAWLRAGQGGDGLVEWVFNLVEPGYLIMDDKVKLDALSCCPRPPRGCPLTWDGYSYAPATDVCEPLGPLQNQSVVPCRRCARHIEHSTHSILDTRITSQFSPNLYSNLTKLSTFTASGTEALPLVREYFNMHGAKKFRLVTRSQSSPDVYETTDYKDLWQPEQVDPYANPPQQPDPGLRASDMWDVSGGEECFLCCYLAGPDSRDQLAPGDDAWDAACEWVEIMGAQLQVSTNGFYQKLPVAQDPSGQGRPAYLHTSGRFFLYFLARACMHEEEGVCPRRGPGWVVGDVLGRDSARLLAWAATDAPAQVVGNYWYEWNGTSYMKTPDPEPIWRTQRGPDGTINASFLEDFAHQDAMTIKVVCASEAPVDNQLPIPFWGTAGQRIQNFTTSIGFVDAKEDSFMSLPDTDGSLLSTGNLQDISSFGTLVAPITAQSGPESLSQLQIGLEWDTVNVTEQSSSFSADIEMGGFKYCYVPRSVCFDLCDNDDIEWLEGESCRRYSCLFPLPRSAFNDSNSDCPLKDHNDVASAGARSVDAIVIQGPPKYGDSPKLGRNDKHDGKLLYFPIFGTFQEEGYCRSSHYMNDDVESPAFDESKREMLWPKVNGSHRCRPLEFTQRVNEDEPPLASDQTEGDCLTINFDRQDGEPASCRREPFKNPSFDLIETSCGEKDLKQQPVCVPHYSMVRWGLRDDRATPRMGEHVEIGPPRTPVTGLRWKSLGGTRPTRGRELFNSALAEALLERTTFELEEWKAFAITDIRIDDFVESGSSFYAPVGVRARLRVEEVQQAINTTNPYSYMFTGGSSPLVESFKPLVKMPTRITTYLSTTSMHVMSFVGNTFTRTSTTQYHVEKRMGEAVIQSQVAYRAPVGQQKLAHLVREMKESLEQQVQAGRGRPLLLEVQLERSGRGWGKHTKGKPVAYATVQERQEAQASHQPLPQPLYGYGSAAQLEPSPTGDEQAAADLADRARGLPSYDPDKFFPHLRTEYAMLVAGVSNASGQVNELDRIVVRFEPEFMPRDQFDPLKANSLLELLNFGHPQDYGGGPDNSTDSLAFGPFQPHLHSADYQGREVMRRRDGWTAGAQAGFARVRGYEAGQRGQALFNNTIHIPSSQDGILLTTSNLLDVKESSSRMTSLAINARRLLEAGTAPSDDADGRVRHALEVGGWLEFGHLESGWSYLSPTRRRANPINYPGPAWDLVTAAEHVHPRLCPSTSAADACVLSKVDMHAIHAKLSEQVISNAFSKAATLEEGVLTPAYLLSSNTSNQTLVRSGRLLTQAFQAQGLSKSEAGLVSEAVLRRAYAAYQRILSQGVLNQKRYTSLHDLNRRLLRFGQSRYSSGLRLLPDGQAQTGKLVFNLSSGHPFPTGGGGVPLSLSTKRVVLSMEQFHQGQQDWSGARQYETADKGGDNLSYLQARAVDGVLVTTANLGDVTAGAGSLTSLNVQGHSTFQETVRVGHGQGGQRQMHLLEPNSSVCDGVLMSADAVQEADKAGYSPQSGAGIGAGICFKEFSTPSRWDDAQAVCKRWGGSLAVLERPHLQEFVHTYVRRTPWRVSSLCARWPLDRKHLPALPEPLHASDLPLFDPISIHKTSWELLQTNCGVEPTASAWVGLASFEYPTIWMWRGQHRDGAPTVPPYPHHDYEQQSAYAGSAHELAVRKQDNARRCAAMAKDSGWDAHDCEERLPFVCQRSDLPLPALSQTHNFEVCDQSFHKEGCAAGATHLALGVPPEGGGLKRETNIVFPSANGTIITTGNLQDVTVLALEYMNITGKVEVEGRVELGSSQRYPDRSARVEQAAADIDELAIEAANWRGELAEPRMRLAESPQMPGGYTQYPLGGQERTRRSQRVLQDEWPVTPIQMSGSGGYLAGDIVFASDEARAESQARANQHGSSVPVASVPSWYTDESKEQARTLASYDSAYDARTLASYTHNPAVDSSTSLYDMARSLGKYDSTESFAKAPVASVPTWYATTFSAQCSAGHCACTAWGAPIDLLPGPDDADCGCGCRLEAMKSTTLSFETALGPNTILFPDATGTIITTGNLNDIDNNIGLRGRDQLVIYHARQAFDNVKSGDLSEEEKNKGQLHGQQVDAPYTVIDMARHGSREDVSLGLNALPLPPGSGKGRLPASNKQPRGIWHIADLGPAGIFGDGDDLVYYMEHMNKEPRGGGGFRPVTGWTVPCTQESGISTALCLSEWWAPPDISFKGWEEYNAREKGALGLAGVDPLPRLRPEKQYEVDELGFNNGCPAAWDQTAFIGRETLRYPLQPGVARNWSDVSDVWQPFFEKCGFQIEAGSPEVVGQYVYADVSDNVARYRKLDSNIYLFRWGSMNQRITFPDAVGVIITTGNPEDLVLKKMTLRALDLVGGEIGAGTSPITKHGVTIVTFDKYQSLMVGDLQIVNDCITEPGQPKCRPETDVFTKFGIVQPRRRDIYTPGAPGYVPDMCRTLEGLKEDLKECNYCTAGAECEDKNEILIPDVSGTVITTGNMDLLPALAIPYASFSTGGRTALQGDITFGSPAPDLTSSQQSFVHPDYLRFSQPDWITRRNFFCDNYESLDERCVIENKAAYCRHGAQVSLDVLDKTGECHVDVNMDGIKREVLMWYTGIDSNKGFTFSSAREAPRLLPAVPSL